MAPEVSGEACSCRSLGRQRLLVTTLFSEMTPTLYSYCLRWDDGAAPNPFWGLCTLAICKPAIRRVAEPGDWVVGLGSSADPVMGDLAGQVVYAMRVSTRLTMREYDEFCRSEQRGKIPDWHSRYFKKRVGDCIYDYQGLDEPRLRRGVHTEKNREVDLGGKNVLLSNHFFYLGNKPRRLPAHLAPIVQLTQGHKSRANAPYVKAFVAWVESLKLRPNKLYGEPIGKRTMIRNASAAMQCRAQDHECDLEDEIC